MFSCSDVDLEACWSQTFLDRHSRHRGRRRLTRPSFERSEKTRWGKYAEAPLLGKSKRQHSVLSGLGLLLRPQLGLASFHTRAVEFYGPCLPFLDQFCGLSRSSFGAGKHSFHVSTFSILRKVEGLHWGCSYFASRSSTCFPYSFPARCRIPLSIVTRTSFSRTANPRR